MAHRGGEAVPGQLLDGAHIALRIDDVRTDDGLLGINASPTREKSMASDGRVLAIDQGTTSSRAIVFDSSGEQVSVAQREFRQIFPDDGWVEHDALEIWDTTLVCCKDVLAELGAENFAAIAITNQRETAVIWERATGKPIANAIVWQDRRTSEICNGLKELSC